MAKIAITFDKKEYELEYSRQTVKNMEAQGFVLEEIGSKPANMIPMLFRGAFMKNHKGIKRSLVDDIYEAMPDKNGLISALIDLYGEALNTLFDDSESATGNGSWTMSR